MQYQTFSKTEHTSYPVAVLVPKLGRDDIEKEYLDPICLDQEKVIAYSLHQTGKKTPVATQKEYLDALIPILEDLSTEYLIVGDGDYFKTLTGVNKADAFLGYVLPNTYPTATAGTFNVVYCPNYRQVFYNPTQVRAKIAQSLNALHDHMHSNYGEPGVEIIQFEQYPTTVDSIRDWLNLFLEWDRPLSADIEAFSLKHYDAGIGTITFCWSKHEGIAFPVDLGSDPKAIRKLLVEFFLAFSNKIIWHNISYDVTVLIYQLFMEHLVDTEGLLNGLEVMLKNWDDTKLISYLATNSCAGNKLGLKDQAQEYAGNYAVEDIKDITKIPLPKLLKYNLVDGLSTWYVYEKHWETLVKDDQLEIYETLFKPAIYDIIQMQLTGMPVDRVEVSLARASLEVDRNDAIDRIQSHPLVQAFVYQLNLEWVEFKNSTYKKKRVTLSDAKEEFNPNSPPQLQRFFYEELELPVIERTKTKQPSTSANVLEKLKAFTTEEDVKQLINALLDFKAVDKIYSTFIPALESSVLAPDGCYYLFGNFNLGGTVSGRLSSSGPNLQTIPSSGTKYAKLIKNCFKPPKGWLMVGLDFSSLEDRISALTTKDPNKLKVYTDSYDGHCLRAYSYFGDRMPDIEIAPENATCYSAKVGASNIYFHSHEDVEYLGKVMKGAELYALLTST